MGLKVCLGSTLGPFNSDKGPRSKPASVLAAAETLLISGPVNCLPLTGAKSCKAAVLVDLKIPIFPLLFSRIPLKV